MTLVRHMYRLANTMHAYSRWTENAPELKASADDVACIQRHLSKRYGTARSKHLVIVDEPFIVS